MFSRKAASVLGFAALLTVAGAVRASASTINFTDDSVTGVGGDYGSIVLEQLSNGVKVTVSLAAGETFVSTGNENTHYAFAFNLLNAPPLTTDEVHVDTPGFTFVGGGGIKNAPLGNFDYGFTSTTQGGQGKTDSLIFTITLPGLTQGSFAVMSNNKNNPGYYFAADIFSATRPIGGQTGTIGVPGSQLGATDFGDPIPTPEPASLLLLGTGLTVVARRFRKNRR